MLLLDQGTMDKEVERRAWLVETFVSLTLMQLSGLTKYEEINKWSAAGIDYGRSNKVNQPSGNWGRTGTAEKEDVAGDVRSRYLMVMEALLDVSCNYNE